MVDIIASDLRNLVDYIESEYLLHGVIPSVTAISKATFLTVASVEEWLVTDELTAMMKRRGISLVSNGLSPEMLATANVLLDFSDRRSKSAKLKSLGVTTQQYNAWKSNRYFNAYCTERAEQLLPASMNEAHTALLQNVERGETQSLKLFYEITGRHNPSAQASFNAEQLVGRIFEIITTRVKDPAILEAIAQDIGNMALQNGSSSSPVAISGELLSI